MLGARQISPGAREHKHAVAHAVLGGLGILVNPIGL